MASVSDQLLAALDDLDTDKLKRFQWHLKDHKCFQLLLWRRMDILKKMNLNPLAEELENKHKQDTPQAESSIEDPAPARAESKPINVTFTNIVPRTRNDFLQYSHQLTLDLNTVNNYLCLSESNRVITDTDTDQSYPDHPDRFSYWPQVLCRESVCGRCYWELEWSGDDGVFISVSYKSISRKGQGNECWFGSNDQSWSLICSFSSYSFKHNNIETRLPVESISRRIGIYDDDDDDIYRIGVFVDHSAGTLSFYSVSDSMSLIHTVQTTFIQPLYPGVWVGYKSSVKLC